MTDVHNMKVAKSGTAAKGRALSATLCRVCVAGGLMWGGLPLYGQTAEQVSQSADEMQLIDLGAVLDAPETLQAPTDRPERLAARPAVEMPDGPLTVPEYARSGQTAANDGSGGDTGAIRIPDHILLPMRAVIPTIDGIQRLSGEVQGERFFVDLPAGSTLESGDGLHDLVLSYRIAINVLPEQSELRVRVNGVEMPPIQPHAFEGFESVVLSDAPLVEGRNEITITVHHSHRIFCGPDATFAVWTEIDTATSGVRLARNAMPGDQAGLAMALRAQLGVQGIVPVRVVDPADAGLLGALTRRLSGVRDGVPVVLTPEPAYGVVDGPAQGARVTLLPSGMFGGLPTAEVRHGADGAMVLALSAGLDGQLPDLDPLLPRIAAPKDIATLLPGTAVRLDDLGFTDRATFNRYSQQTLAFRMPRDWLLLASQKAALNLVYGFSAGLPKGALMLVKVNDTTVRLLPLDSKGGTIQPPLEIGFPARLLHPGANALRFETIVPGDPPDLPCPPVTAPLMQIEPESTLLVPASPQMRIDGVDAALVDVRPDQIRPVPRDGDDPVAEALVVALASTLRPIDGTERHEAASLTVTDSAGLDRLGIESLGDAGIPGLTRRDLDRLFAANGPGVGPTPATDDANPNLAEPGPEATEAPGLTERVRTIAAGMTGRVMQLAKPGDGPVDRWLDGRTAKAVLIMPDADMPESLSLIVAKGTDPQQIAVLLSQARISPNGPRGRLSVLSPDGQWNSWNDTTYPPVLEEPLTVSNFRAVAGNYASWSPVLFGAVLFVLTLLSVAMALIFVVTTRGRRKR